MNVYGIDFLRRLRARRARARRDEQRRQAAAIERVLRYRAGGGDHGGR